MGRTCKASNRKYFLSDQAIHRYIRDNSLAADTANFVICAAVAVAVVAAAAVVAANCCYSSYFGCCYCQHCCCYRSCFWQNWGLRRAYWKTWKRLSLWSRHYTLRPRQNRRNFADDIFQCIFLNKNLWISIKISPNFVLKCPITIFHHWLR